MNFTVIGLLLEEKMEVKVPFLEFHVKASALAPFCDVMDFTLLKAKLSFVNLNGLRDRGYGLAVLLANRPTNHSVACALLGSLHHHHQMALAFAHPRLHGNEEGNASCE